MSKWILAGYVLVAIVCYFVIRWGIIKKDKDWYTIWDRADNMAASMLWPLYWTSFIIQYMLRIVSAFIKWIQEHVFKLNPDNTSKW